VGRIAVVLLGLTGCNQIFGIEEIGHTPPDALAGDIANRPGDANDGLSCLGHLGIRVCLTQVGTLPIPATIDTDTITCTQVLPMTNGPDACVLAAQNLQLDTTIRVTGTRSLVLFAATDLVLTSNSVLKAQSDGSGLGPGLSLASCPANGGTNGYGNASGGGGGAGGNFQGSGGLGGAGAHASGGQVGASPALAVVRGGCPGGPGGNDAIANPGAVGGSGGGAIYLLAGRSITINGTINASGASGQGGSAATGAGGGGGGAGGMIVLDAPTVSVGTTGSAFALGGGGGGGADPTNGANAAPGGVPRGPAMPGGAGAGATANAGSGGQGSSPLSGSPGSSTAATTNSGAGGGGGGGGYVVIYGTYSVSGAAAPPVTLGP
jgi:hypothetical protein